MRNFVNNLDRIVCKIQLILNIFTFYIEEQHTPKSHHFMIIENVFSHIDSVLFFCFFFSIFKYMKAFCTLCTCIYCILYSLFREWNLVYVVVSFIHFKAVQAQKELIIIIMLNTYVQYMANGLSRYIHYV